jgi:hypothetical protein
MSDIVKRLRSEQNPGLAVRQQAADAIESLTAENAALTKANGEWTVACADLRVRLAEADAHGKAQQQWAHAWREKADGLEARLAEANALLREYAQDALDDLNNWSGYATDYFQQKHDLAGDQAKWQARIDAHLARQP